MDVIRPGQDERCRNGEDNHNDVTVTKFICRETGDHVHFPQRHRARSPLPHHAPSPIFSSGSEPNPGAGTCIRYSECRKNQAAGIGATAYDGCGEFVAAGDDSMKCAACGCHRSFHRREPSTYFEGSMQIHNRGGATTASAAAAAILKALELSSVDFRQIFRSPWGRGGEEEAKESLEDQDRSGKELPICGREGKEWSENQDRKAKERPICGEAAGTGKRFKTKFTAEQTERMRKYAEKLRWRMSNESGEEVETFCAEIGVPRERFRIWMNNHKAK